MAVASGLSTSSRVVTAVSPAASPMPTSTSLAGLIPRCQARAVMPKATTKAPPMATGASSSEVPVTPPSQRNSTAAAEAPLVMPMTSGDASGFLTRPCRMRPAEPRAAPTRMAMSILGRRISRTINASCDWFGATSVPSTSITEVGWLPDVSARTLLTASTTASTPVTTRTLVLSLIDQWSLRERSIRVRLMILSSRVGRDGGTAVCPAALS